MLTAISQAVICVKMSELPRSIVATKSLTKAQYLVIAEVSFTQSKDEASNVNYDRS